MKTTNLPPEKIFNAEGPIIAEDHYKVSSLTRIKITEIVSLIERKKSLDLG